MDLLYPPVHRSHSMVTLKGHSNAEENNSAENKLLQEKFSRLLESHHRLLRVNQGLEDKLLRVVTNCEEQKEAMRIETETIREELVFYKTQSERLERENVKYKEDCLLAIQLLQCNPTNFTDQSFESLPGRVRRKLVGQNGLSQNNTDFSETEESETEESSDIQIFPSFFPPCAVMVPIKRKKNTHLNSQKNTFNNQKNNFNNQNNFNFNNQNINFNNQNINFGGQNSCVSGQNSCVSGRYSSQKTTVESVAQIISNDLRDLSLPAHCDVRARPSSSLLKEKTTTGKVFDV